MKSLWEEPPEETRESEALSDHLTLEELYTPPRFPLEAVKWEEIWSVLTEPRQLGLGEGLATEMWLAKDFEAEISLPPQTKGLVAGKARLEEAKHKLQTWATGGTEDLLPALRLDGRRLDHFPQVREVSEKSRQALIDPYAELICEFKEIDPRSLSWERGQTGSYAFSSGANLKLGQWRLTEWNLRGAEASFRSALKADAHDPEAWWYLGMARLFLRKNRAAQKAFRQALDHRPNEVRSQLGLGLTYYHERDYAKAEECFSRVKGPDRRGTGARSFLACCYRLQRKFPQALSEIHHLETSEIQGWRAMGEQCRRCAARGEEKPRRRSWRFWLFSGIALAWLGAGAINEIIRLMQEGPGGEAGLLEKITGNLALFGALAFVLLEAAHFIKGKIGRREEIPYGDGKESLPCWQTRAWMRPHKLDLFGHALPIPRK